MSNNMRQREVVSRLPAGSAQQGRAQRAAGAGQRDLSPGGRAVPPRQFAFPFHLNDVTRPISGMAKIDKTARPGRSGPGRRRLMPEAMRRVAARSPPGMR